MSAEDDIVQWKLEGNTGPIQRELNFMKYNKLAVCGCSVSDRTKVEYAYGDYLSAKLDIDYLHFAGGAGSDKRGFRLLVQAIQRGEVDKNTLVLFQPAEVIRREIPSHVTEEEYQIHVDGVIEKNIANPKEKSTPVYDKTLSGAIVSRFKIDSCHWQGNDIDRQMHLAYQEKPGCLSNDYDAEMLSVYWYMLQGLCDSKGIDLVMFIDDVRGWPSWLSASSKMFNHFHLVFDQSKWINIRDLWDDHERYEVYSLDPPHDRVHFNEVGHIKVADDLHRELTKRGLL